MKSEPKYLDKTEACYKTEYALRKDIHYRKGEILKLEHINAKQCREIERLNNQMKILLETPDISDVDPSLDLFQYIKELIVQSSCNSPEKTHKANINDVDLDYVKSALKYVIPGLFDPYAFLSMDEKHRVASSESYMFDHLKDLILKLSREKGNTPINPDKIDVKYVETACLYCFPVLFDKYALLDQDGSNAQKIEMVNDILHRFGLTEMRMYEYENLQSRDEIYIKFVDLRSAPVQKDPRTLLSKDDKHKIELADSILGKFGIGTMAKYEELFERGDIDIDILDHRF